MAEKLNEIKRGESGYGLIIDNDGYISAEVGDNQRLFEASDPAKSSQDGFLCPYPFIVSAVMQKYGIENANGRIYPESVLKRQVELYMEKIKEKRAIGECYTPNAMALTPTGWRPLFDLEEGDEVVTLNTLTGKVEIQPVVGVTKKRPQGELTRIRANGIDDLVTGGHGYPLFKKNGSFDRFITADEMRVSDSRPDLNFLKELRWEGDNAPYVVVDAVEDEEADPKYKTDLDFPAARFAEFMAICVTRGKVEDDYLSMTVTSQDVASALERAYNEAGVDYVSDELTYTTDDKRLVNLIVSLTSEDGVIRVAPRLKTKNPTVLKTFYTRLLTCIDNLEFKLDAQTRSFSCHDKQLALDINEICNKFGRQNDIVKVTSSNGSVSWCTYDTGITKVPFDKSKMSMAYEDWNGEVGCIETENHTWYVMDHGKCHWTKNCNHPSESVIDLSRVAINVIEAHWEGHTLIGKLEILTSPGFRRYGNITCQGDQVANLLLHGIKIGVSSRGLGTVVNKMGTMYVSDDYEIVCWDVVSDPSTPNAWIVPDGKIPSTYVESKENKGKDPLIEGLDKFGEWLDD